MIQLKGKSILIISPQEWGKMFISKHHYAHELAALGNTVYFLNPPDQNNGKAYIKFEPLEGQSNLILIYHRTWFPFILKFHALSLFQWLMKFHIKSLIKKIGHPIDLVWSFDLGNLYPLYYFPKDAIKIFHPVDEPSTKAAIDAAKGADIIFSVTNEILAKYKQYNIPAQFINHGVTKSFIQEAILNYRPTNPIRIGFSGNLLRGDIDRVALIDIITENSSVQFDCWGSYSNNDSNIGGSNDSGAINFISQLKQLPNVKLHGAIASFKLANELKQADAFLICYDVNLDQSKGTNYHKIMEYLGTGKVIVSNNVSTYKDKPHLIQMVAERDTNVNLKALFTSVVANLSYHNNNILQQERILFAEENLYNKQIEKIEIALSDLISSKKKFSSNGFV